MAQRKAHNEIIISENPIPESYFVNNKMNKDNFENQANQILTLLKKAIPSSEDLKITRLSLDIYFEDNLSFQN